MCEFANRTITVEDFFNDEKNINKPDFIRTWTEHVNQIKSINYDPKWQSECEIILMKVKIEAAHRFEEIYKLQGENK